MRVSKKIATLGVMLSALGVLAAAPAVGATSVTQTKSGQNVLDRKVSKQKLLHVATESNRAINVSTDLSCTDHTLTANVTNKTDGNITPDVTFNDAKPSFPTDPMPIEPGKTGNYSWSYSGNNLLTKIKVHVDTYKDVTLSPTLNCNEPVSFMTTDTSSSMVAGTLSNNSEFVAQTVYTRVDGGDIRVESLKPGESRDIALPFDSVIPDPTTAYVSIGTDGGYQGNYTVDLTNQGTPGTPK